MTTPTRRRTTPGSIGHTIAECVREAVAAVGAPRLVADCQSDYVARHGSAPATYNAQFYSLVRRGILVARDGRASRTRYAHRDSGASVATTAPDADDDAMKVLAALAQAVRDTGGPATTAQVTTALATLHLTLTTTDINAVRVRLQTLARTRHSGVAAWSAARVISHDVTTAGGRRMRCWSLAGQPATALPSAPVFSGADAVRALVRHVQSCLHRPVLRRELGWWMDAHSGDPIAVAVQQHLASKERSLSDLLGFTMRADRKWPRPGHELTRIGGQYSCWGGLAPRYWVGPLGDDERLADRLQELSVGLQAADEITTLDQMARRATVLGISALTDLVRVRRDVLATTRDGYLAADQQTLATVLTTLVQSFLLCRAWVNASSSDDQRYARLEGLRVRERHAMALAAFQHVPQAHRAVAVVGACGTVSFSDLAPFLRAAEQELAIPRALARKQALRGARRVPTGQAPQYGSHSQRGDVAIDRVDALRRMYHLVSAPRAQALLDAAAELLGPVLRDADVLKAVGHAGAVHPRVRRAVMVARAMLGIAPESPAPREDVFDGRAWLLAHTLAGTTPLPSTNDTRLAVAERRLAAGRLLTALG
jgi:hypothetical protein